MSSSTLKPPPTHLKQLRELLQEKQEPFALDIYLSERYPKTNYPNSNSLKRTHNFDSKKRRTGLPNSSNVLKLVTNKLISYRTRSKLSSCREKFSKRSTFQALKPQRLRELKCQQADTTKCQCGSTVDIKQLIPLSAEASSTHKNKKYVLITREEESKWVVSRQTKQLLYDCANRKLVVPKERKKIICKQICSWGKQSADLKEIAQMINSDFSNEMEQWNNFQLVNSDIRIEIGNAILDDIVSEVIQNYIAGY